MFTALPVATTTNANNGTMNQPKFQLPINGTWITSTPSFAKKYHPRTNPIMVIIANFKFERSPATPLPDPRILIMSSKSPTSAPPISAASGNHVWPRSKLKSVTIVIESTNISPAIVGILRVNLFAWSLLKTVNASPVVLLVRCFFQNLYRYATKV